jgi:hypothetical protein
LAGLSRVLREAHHHHKLQLQVSLSTPPSYALTRNNLKIVARGADKEDEAAA